MAFESKRLRVQLPCPKAGTVIEKGPQPDPAPGPGETGWCEYPTQLCQNLRTAVCRDHHSPITCGFPTPGCPGVASPTTCFHTPTCNFGTRNCGFPSPTCFEFASPPCHRFVSEPCNGFETVCPEGSVMCRGGGTEPWETRTCTPSPIERTIFEIPIELNAEEPDTVLVHPDHLPQLRRQLEGELDRISALETRKTEVEGQLKDLDSAEKELKKKAKRK